PDRPAVGTEVALTYKPPESHGPAPDRKATFKLAGYLPAEGVAADPGLTPDFPGVTDRDDVGAWDLPVDDEDWKKNVSKEYGDLYWKEFRTTPKAYVNLAKGKELWASRFGELTSVRLAPSGSSDGDKLEEAAWRYREALRRRLVPASGGFVFDPVKET